MQKRSVTIAGHRTSVSLEDAFWDDLAAIAVRDGKTIAGLIAEVDERRDTNLSSALRVYVLADARKQATARGLSEDP
tara:strand:+ start:318 stop:548 length:231 start_codon:yes stop_codon:yes gene_type:complete